MKKWIAILLAMLLLVSCSGKVETEKPGETEKPVVYPPTAPEQTGGEAGAPETDQPPEGMAVKEETLAYRYGMDGYEDLRVAFLGCMSDGRDLDDILARAGKWPGFALLNEITENDIVYGLCNGFANNVYLIIPAFDTDLRVGKYSWFANEIVEEWYSADSSDPILFIETADGMDVLSRIEYVRHFQNGESSEGFMDAGLNVMSGKLRTDYHMGIVDVTPYDKFSSDEIPFYQQFFFDSLQEVAEVSSTLEKGGSLTAMEEMVHEGNTYAVYDLSDAAGTSHTLYAIRIDSDSGHRKIIYSTNYKDWYTAGMG